MTLALAVLFAVSLTINALFAFGIRESRVREIAAVRREAITAERLFAAWKDGYNVPPPPEEPAPPPEQLHPGLRAMIEDWEDVDGQAAQEKVIRSYLAKGFSQEDTLKALMPQAVQEEVTDGS